MCATGVEIPQRTRLQKEQRMRLLLICAIVVVAWGVAVAQVAKSGGGVPVVGVNTGGPVTPPNPLFERMGKDPSVYSRSVTGTIVTLDSTRGSLVLEGADKTQLTFVVDSKVRVRADKDTAMAGRKDLSLSDYNPGQFVRVTYRVADNKALEVRLKRARS
jgi:hypothetical protein